MKRRLEEDLWASLPFVDDIRDQRRGLGAVREWTRLRLAAGEIASARQVRATLMKWARKGWYAWGVALHRGWRVVPGPLPHRATRGASGVSPSPPPAIEGE